MANMLCIFRSDDVEANEGEFSLVKSGETIPVEPKAFRLLLFFLRNPQRLVSKEELLGGVWGETAVSENSLTRAIALLRKLLGDEARDPRYIETVATVGYRWLSKVEVHEERAAEQVDGGWAENSPDTCVQRAQPPRYKMWLPLATVLGIALVVAVAWQLNRVPSTPIVVNYTQITHDGRHKELVGTDGTRLYLNWDYGANSIAQVSVAGGEIVPIPVELPLPTLRVSPDGSDLLLMSSAGDHDTIWSFQVLGSSLRQLRGGLSINAATWFPDGKSLLLRSRSGDLNVMSSTGNEQKRLGTAGSSMSLPAISPDGTRVRFSKDNRLWQMSIDGTGSHELLPGWHPSSSACCGRWTADGKFFVFLEHSSAVRGAPGESQIWILDERRGMFQHSTPLPVQLTSGPIRWNAPLPNREGTTIFADGAILRGELVQYDPRVQQLVTWLAGLSAEFVSFSKDGKSIAYVTFPEGILWKAASDGSNRVQLTQPPGYPINPRWSPDGTRILFSQADSSSRFHTYVISAQGGQPEPLLPNKEASSDPNWSPDGSKIVYSSLAGTEEIGSIDTSLRILDVSNRRSTTVQGSEGVWSPRWSPDGRFLAGLYHGPSGGIKVFDFQTNRWTAIRAQGENDFPTWSSDSQFLYVLRARENPGIYRIRATTGFVERVVDLKGFRFTGALGFWMGLDSDDKPILLRDEGTDDIYALTLDHKR